MSVRKSSRPFAKTRLGVELLESRVVCNAAMHPGPMLADLDDAGYAPRAIHFGPDRPSPIVFVPVREIEAPQVTWTMTVVVSVVVVSRPTIVNVVVNEPVVSTAPYEPPVATNVSAVVAPKATVRSTPRAEATETVSLPAPPPTTSVVAALATVANGRATGDVASAFASLAADRSAAPLNFRFPTSDAVPVREAASAAPESERSPAPLSSPPVESAAAPSTFAPSVEPPSGLPRLSELLIDGIGLASQAFHGTVRALEDSARAIAEGGLGAWTWLGISSWALALAVAAESAIQARVRAGLVRLGRAKRPTEDDRHVG